MSFRELSGVFGCRGEPFPKVVGQFWGDLFVVRKDVADLVLNRVMVEQRPAHLPTARVSSS